LQNKFCTPSEKPCQEGFYPHIDQANDGADGIIGVQGAQHQMAGEG
jgi:hypothetical protein